MRGSRAIKRPQKFIDGEIGGELTAADRNAVSVVVRFKDEEENNMPITKEVSFVDDLKYLDNRPVRHLEDLKLGQEVLSLYRGNVMWEAVVVRTSHGSDNAESQNNSNSCKKVCTVTEEKTDKKTNEKTDKKTKEKKGSKENTAASTRKSENISQKKKKTENQINKEVGVKNQEKESNGTEKLQKKKKELKAEENANKAAAFAARQALAAQLFSNKQPNSDVSTNDPGVTFVPADNPTCYRANPDPNNHDKDSGPSDNTDHSVNTDRNANSGPSSNPGPSANSGPGANSGPDANSGQSASHGPGAQSGHGANLGPGASCGTNVNPGSSANLGYVANPNPIVCSDANPDTNVNPGSVANSGPNVNPGSSAIICSGANPNPNFYPSANPLYPNVCPGPDVNPYHNVYPGPGANPYPNANSVPGVNTYPNVYPDRSSNHVPGSVSYPAVTDLITFNSNLYDGQSQQNQPNFNFGLSPFNFGFSQPMYPPRMPLNMNFPPSMCLSPINHPPTENEPHDCPTSQSTSDDESDLVTKSLDLINDNTGNSANTDTPLHDTLHDGMQQPCVSYCSPDSMKTHAPEQESNSDMAGCPGCLAKDLLIKDLKHQIRVLKGSHDEASSSVTLNRKRQYIPKTRPEITFAPYLLLENPTNPKVPDGYQQLAANAPVAVPVHWLKDTLTTISRTTDRRKRKKANKTGQFRQHDAGKETIRKLMDGFYDATELAIPGGTRSFTNDPIHKSLKLYAVHVLNLTEPVFNECWNKKMTYYRTLLKKSGKLSSVCDTAFEN